MTTEIILAIISVVSAPLAGWFVFLYTKQKYTVEIEELKVKVLGDKKEVESSEIDNDIKLSGHYKDILNDLPIHYDKKFKEYEAMVTLKIQNLEEQIKITEILWKKKTQALQEEIKLKNEKIKLLAENNKQLLKENIELKKENKLLKNENR